MTTIPYQRRVPRADWKAVAASQQFVLAVLILVEVAVFSFTGTNFFTARNAIEMLRKNLEVGLLAVAMTPVIVTGGIDLSVGSLLGLSAVLFGKLWAQAQWPLPVAALSAVAVGLLAGLLNGTLITRLRVRPLIVTLGTFSLFRGMAEGITGGAEKYNFPVGFTQLGQGYQLIVLAVVAAAFWALLHRMAIGRALTAIGFAPDGARYAGIPVERRIVLVYALAGVTAGLAAVVYCARVGQAQADVGSWYELYAVTAVVLGGTSIFGGRGSVLGSLLGWLSIAVLQQGLTLSDMPTELGGILTGVLLLGAIIVNQVLSSFAGRRRGAE